METLELARLALKGGRKADKFNDYLNVYKLITGHEYPQTNCTGCSLKFLHRFIENWYDKNKEKL